MTFPTLKLLFADDAGVVHAPARVLRAITRIGREVPDNQGIGLAADRRASRVHAVLHTRPDGTEVRLVDEKSKNGSFVNGRQVSECVLHDGDLLRIGNSLLLLRVEPARSVDAELPGMLGSAPAVRAVRAALSRVARSVATVLLLGDSGTGKEVAAQALHQVSGRRGPMLALNCAAIPETLAESQLFGHQTGAFTGAKGPQLGYFRAADGGTLFLDELGELPLPLQAKLLRTLEDRQVVPVGSTQPVAVDVRVIAATNRDLAAAVQAGTFRGDLHARIAEIVVRLPPLRDRREDILALLLHFLGKPEPRLSPELAEALLLYPWPYNVRELAKVATQLRLGAEGADELTLEMVADRLVAPALPPPPAQVAAAAPQDDEAARGPAPSRDELDRLLREHKGVIAQVARAVGRSRRQVDRWIEQYGLDRKDFTK